MKDIQRLEERAKCLYRDRYSVDADVKLVTKFYLNHWGAMNSPVHTLSEIRRSVKRRKFRVKDVRPVHDMHASTILIAPAEAVTSSGSRVKDKRISLKNLDDLHLEPVDGFGVWEADLAPEGRVLIVQELRETNLVSVLVTTERDAIVLKRVVSEGANFMTRWKNGSFTVYMSPQGPVVSKQRVPSTPVEHPATNEVVSFVNAYFSDPKPYLRYKKSGLRKAILKGPPGTGKSSIFYRLVNELRDSLTLVWASDIQCAAYALERAAKHNQKIVVFLEDAEQALTFQGEVGAEVLNLLDGAGTPRNTAGSMLLMTTNRPAEIEARVMQRPGRVDRVFDVGVLTAPYAIKAANLYLPEDHEISNIQLGEAMKGFTGAEVMAICESLIDASISRDVKITGGLMKEVIQSYGEAMRQARKVIESKLLEPEPEIGFYLGGQPNLERPALI
jgi:hypothetical protein